MSPSVLNGSALKDSRGISMIRQVIIRYTLEPHDRGKIRLYMKEHNLSIRGLAKILGYSPTFICDVLKGRNYLPENFHAWLRDMGIL